ncbi:YybH family protein [Ekhidna sp.]|uniref:YybH family protein n=1 Tax=Ekhidna sp. TaxID=2608089 RepID=UPI003C79CDE1
MILLIVLISCNQSTQSGFSEEDQKTIEQMSKTYVNGWLTNDKATVLNLFHSDASIIPSGMAPIQGKDAIEAYWFPTDSSTTTIHSYEVELLKLQGADSMAYSLEKGVLEFTYEKGDFSMSKTSISHATTVYKKKINGEWKILSRMWTQLN